MSRPTRDLAIAWAGSIKGSREAIRLRRQLRRRARKGDGLAAHATTLSESKVAQRPLQAAHARETMRQYLGLYRPELNKRGEHDGQ